MKRIALFALLFAAFPALGQVPGGGIPPQTIAAIGTVTDTAVTNPALSGSLVAIGKGLLTSSGSGGAVSTAIGTINDAAVTDYTQPCSLIACTKGVLALLASTNPVQTYSSNTYLNIATNTTTVVKSGAGTFFGVSWNALGTTEVLTIYDNTAGSGTQIGVQSSVAAQGFVGVGPGVAFATGLTIVSSGVSTGNWTVVYR